MPEALAVDAETLACDALPAENITASGEHHCQGAVKWGSKS